MTSTVRTSVGVEASSVSVTDPLVAAGPMTRVTASSAPPSWKYVLTVS